MSNYKAQMTNQAQNPNDKNKLKTKTGLVRTFYFLIVVFTFYFSLFTSPAALAQSFSLGVFPPLMEIVALPGATISQPLELSNMADEKVIRAYPQAFSAGADGQPAFLNGPQDFFSWIEIEGLGDSSHSLLKSGAKKRLTLKIKVPEEAEEKDYYFTLFFEHQLDSGLIKETSSQTLGRIGLNVLLSVSKTGKPPRQGIVKKFSLPKLVDSFSSVPITLTVQNVGRSFFKPTGAINITNNITKSQYKLYVLPQNVLANSSRSMIVLKSLPTVTEDGEPIDQQPEQAQNEKDASPLQKIYRLFGSFPRSPQQTSFDPGSGTSYDPGSVLWRPRLTWWLPDRPLLGKYKVRLQLTAGHQTAPGTAGQSGPLMESSIYFYALPYKAIIVIAVLYILYKIIRPVLIQRGDKKHLLDTT